MPKVCACVCGKILTQCQQQNLGRGQCQQAYTKIKRKFTVTVHDLTSDLMGSHLASATSLHQIQCKSVQYFLCNPAGQASRHRWLHNLLVEVLRITMNLCSVSDIQSQLTHCFPSQPLCLFHSYSCFQWQPKMTSLIVFTLFLPVIYNLTRPGLSTPTPPPHSLFILFCSYSWVCGRLALSLGWHLTVKVHNIQHSDQATNQELNNE